MEDRRCASPVENTSSIYRDREKGEVEEVEEVEEGEPCKVFYSREGGVE